MADIQVDITYLKKLYQQAKMNRVPLEADWYLNLSYYMGDQWVFWNKGRIDRPRLEAWRVQFTDNRIRPVVVTRVAKASASRPNFTCVPSTAEDSDMADAEIGNAVLEYQWKQSKLSYKHMMALFWKEITGAGLWKIYWNSSSGKKADYLYSGDQFMRNGKAPIRDGTDAAKVARGVMESQGKSVETKSLYQGDLCIDVMSPFEIYPDPIANSLDECEWIIEEKIKSKEYVAMKYNDPNVQEDATIPIGIVESRTTALAANQGRNSARGVRVYEMYCKPNRKFPQGAWCIWYNDKIKVSKTCDESPYADFPYVMFSADIIPGRFWPGPTTSQLRGPQTDLNKIQSQIRENAIRIGNPAVAMSREANIKWTGKSAEKVYYSDVVTNPLPQFIVPPEIPVYVREEVERIEKSITEISGIHDISNGSVPTGVTAASAINLLQEADNTRLGPEVQLMEETLATAGEYILKVLAKFAPDERTIRISGEDGKWDIAKWKAKTLSNIMGVEVQAGSGMPTSKAARQAAMQELLALALQYGVPLNQRSMRQFFKDYEMGGLEKLFSDIENDETQITRENRKMYNGEMFPPNEFDNDELHIEGHQEEMKTSKWEGQDPKIQGIYIAHLKLHKEKQLAAVNAKVKTMQEEQMKAAEAQEFNKENEAQRDLKSTLTQEAVKASLQGGEE
jgi:hypothetical protein